MKTAVSVPDDIFREADRLARLRGASRSELYSKALQEYISRHSPDAVTEAMNRVCAKVGKQPDRFLKATGRRSLKRIEW